MTTDGTHLDFKGGKQLAAALRRLPEDVSGPILQEGLNAGADLIRADASMRARRRRGPRRRPAAVALADTIKLYPGVVEKTHAITDAGTRSPIAHLVEFGHRKVARGPARNGTDKESRRGLRVALRERRERSSGNVPAYPFMRPAADENKEDALKRIGEVLGKEIEQSFRRNAPQAR